MYNYYIDQKLKKERELKEKAQILSEIKKEKRKSKKNNIKIKKIRKNG